MKNIKKWLIASIILVSFILSNTLVSADPTVDNIETVPENPEPLSTVKIIVTVTGEDISSVIITAAECSDEDDTCYQNHDPIAMTLNDDGKYEIEITLKDAAGLTDHIQYTFLINDSGIEYVLVGEWKTYLDLGTNDNGGSTTNGDSNGDNGTPGFELVFVLIAVFVGVALYRRKR